MWWSNVMIGARVGVPVVRLQSPSAKQWQTVHSGSSYCSQSELALTFGLGHDTLADLTIEWPSGARQQFKDVRANQLLKVDETAGLAR